MLSTGTAIFIFRGLALVALLWLAYVIFRTRSARSWPTVVGKVLESRVDTDADSNSVPIVRYSYTVNGHDYVGTRILPSGTLATSGNYAARKVVQYRVGSTVYVRVNPASPTDAALECEVPHVVHLMLAVAIVAFWWMAGNFRMDSTQ
ncbi:DUF3592 domain-containing protein [Hydrogenophaga sp.]|uniref:DUF3592 domain-containing protein n=1 Tax=Hydrogenophaga sp. TaxID=1904254 RepID=UPI00345A4BF5